MDTPRKVIHELALSAACDPIVSANRRSRFGSPGRFVERQPEAVRALLRELRPEDVADVAPWWIAMMVAPREPR